MNILSLFDGMACGMIAMQKAGIEVERYVAYEIDKYAVQTSSHNFPMIEHRGDVFTADFTEFSGFDFLVGGSPCTYWSIAQKNNRETEASGMGWELFQQYVRAIKEAEPKYFIYENNKSMSKAIRESIDKAFGFEADLHPRNIIDPKRIEVKTPDVSIKVAPDRSDLIETRIINGVKYILICADEDVEVNGVNIHIGDKEPATV